MTDHEKRASERVPVALRIRLRYQAVDQFISKFAVNISRGGMFLSSRNPKSPGTRIYFEILLADESPVIEGNGEVRWIREYDRRRPDQPYGMGIRFVALSDASWPLLERIILHRRATGEFNDDEIPEPGRLWFRRDTRGPLVDPGGDADGDPPDSRLRAAVEGDPDDSNADRVDRPGEADRRRPSRESRGYREPPTRRDEIRAARDDAARRAALDDTAPREDFDPDERRRAEDAARRAALDDTAPREDLIDAAARGRSSRDDAAPRPDDDALDTAQHRELDRSDERAAARDRGANGHTAARAATDHEHGAATDHEHRAATDHEHGAATDHEHRAATDHEHRAATDHEHRAATDHEARRAAGTHEPADRVGDDDPEVIASVARPPGQPTPTNGTRADRGDDSPHDRLRRELMRALGPSVLLAQAETTPIAAPGPADEPERETAAREHEDERAPEPEDDRARERERAAGWAPSREDERAPEPEDERAPGREAAPPRHETAWAPEPEAEPLRHEGAWAPEPEAEPLRQGAAWAPEPEAEPLRHGAAWAPEPEAEPLRHGAARAPEPEAARASRSEAAAPRHEAARAPGHEASMPSPRRRTAPPTEPVVRAAMRRARALTSGGAAELDRELAELLEHAAVPVEISVEAASRELAERLGGAPVRPRHAAPGPSSASAPPPGPPGPTEAAADDEPTPAASRRVRSIDAQPSPGESHAARLLRGK